MTEFAQILAAGLIALYAMVGGAMFNAAITSPHNCQVLLDKVWGGLVAVALLSALVVGVAAGMVAFFGAVGFWDNPPIWVCLAHIALMPIALACRWVTDQLAPRDGSSRPPIPRE